MEEFRLNKVEEAVADAAIPRNAVSRKCAVIMDTVRVEHVVQNAVGINVRLADLIDTEDVRHDLFHDDFEGRVFLVEIVVCISTVVRRLIPSCII